MFTSVFLAGTRAGIPDLTGCTSRLRLLGLAAKVNGSTPDYRAASVADPRAIAAISSALSCDGRRDFVGAFARASDVGHRELSVA